MASKKNNKKRKYTKQKNKKQNEIILYVISILVIALLIISLFKFGTFGLLFDKTFKNVFGLVPHYIITIQLIAYFIYAIIQAKFMKLTSRYVIASIFLFLGLMLLFANIDSNLIGFKALEIKNIDNSCLGYLQLFLYACFSQLFAANGTLIFAIAFIMISVIIYFMISLSHIIKKQGTNIKNVAIASKDNIKRFNINVKRNKKIKEFKFDDSIEEDSNVEIEEKEEINENNNITIDEQLPFDLEPDLIEEEKEVEIKLDNNKIKTKYQNYVLPSFKLLNNPINNNALNVNRGYANEKAKVLVSFLKEFNLEVSLSQINIGPSITKFEIVLSAGTKVNRITSLADDIKMALAVKEIRIEAPIPGKSAVGIEIPNIKNSLITLKEVLNDIDYEKENKLVFALGKDINGKSIYTSLDKMPHLLVAGATGSGKSVCINSIIVSLLMNANYNDVKLLLIDPKKVELNIYNGLPHLITPVVSDPKSASIALKKVVEEMERRYHVFAQYNCKNISSYNRFAKEFNDNLSDESLKIDKLPYIVVIIDELADLMMVSPKDVEECIMRITQMARAAGIHLIVATQRPSTDVITGIIKANIPSRIAFAVSSSIDSRTILDMIGAEKLLGKGDMLFFPTGVSAPIRVQGSFLSDDEVTKVVNSIKKQGIVIDVNNNFVNLEKSSNEFINSDDDLYYDVESFVKRQEQVSTSKLQREFKIGYNRAARLIDDLEANGIISSQNGSKPREVLIKNEELD